MLLNKNIILPFLCELCFKASCSMTDSTELWEVVSLSGPGDTGLARGRVMGQARATTISDVTVWRVFSLPSSALYWAVCEAPGRWFALRVHTGLPQSDSASVSSPCGELFKVEKERLDWIIFWYLPILCGARELIWRDGSWKEWQFKFLLATLLQTLSTAR